MLRAMWSAGSPHKPIRCFAAPCPTFATRLTHQFTHGIEVDGGTLYASTPEAVYSWAYDANTGAATNRRTVVSNMTSPSHPTRTLLLSRLQENTLLVSRGSGGNLDMLAASQDSGISQLRSFNLGTLADNSSYDYANDGTLMAWGLRNSVGVAEHPTAGGIWTVENSADQIHRLGEDIHKDNPGEEVNYHGVLGQESNTTGRNYGYPHCLALWNTTDFPDIGSMTVGSQFSFEESSETDDACNSEFVAPRLTFQVRLRPLIHHANNTGAHGPARHQVCPQGRPRLHCAARELEPRRARRLQAHRGQVGRERRAARGGRRQHDGVHRHCYQPRPVKVPRRVFPPRRARAR